MVFRSYEFKVDKDGAEVSRNATSSFGDSKEKVKFCFPRLTSGDSFFFIFF